MTVPHVETDCNCLSIEGLFSLGMPWRVVGVDETGGRFADVAIFKCEACGRLWLHYLVEHEAFRASGKWARGVVSAELARTITPQIAAVTLAALPSYIYGGSYFSGKVARGSGPMPW
ncbi:MAG: hypothetical protein ABIW83_07825 [Allosphingosinicella sp.]